MKVILLRQVVKVGRVGDVVDVSDGYAVNSLFPNKLAIPATTKNLSALNRKIASVKATKALEHGLLEAAIKALPNMTITIVVKANDKGHLFSKVDVSDIVSALEKQRISISTKNVILSKPIKELGTYPVRIVEGEYTQSISVIVMKE